MMQLSGQGQAILGELVKHIRTGKVIPGDPRTYTYYQTVHDALRLEIRGDGYGTSLTEQGLRDLALWCHAKGHPAITGLIVAKKDHEPGSGYYDAFDVRADRYKWWKEEIRKALEKDWSEFLPDDPEDEPEVEPDQPTPAASDLDQPPQSVLSITYRILRDTEVARSVKSFHNHECQICGTTIILPDGSRYAEAHHIHPLGKGGPDKPYNVMCVCPNHHAELDYGVSPIDLAKLHKHPLHVIDEGIVAHHNREIYRPRAKPAG